MPILQFYKQLQPDKKIYLQHAFLQPGFAIIIHEEIERVKTNMIILDPEIPDFVTQYRILKLELNFWQEIMTVITTAAKEFTNA